MQLDDRHRHPGPQIPSGPVKAQVPTRPRRSASLDALTKSALALPGLAGLAPLAAPVAQADAPVADVQAEFSGSWYKEAPISEDDCAGVFCLSTERYSIQAYQLGVTAPLTNQIDFDVDFVFETMSGATPWYVMPASAVPGLGDPTNRPVQAMTGATIEETRIDGQFTVNHYFDRSRLSMSGGFSNENDYGSGNFGLSAERSYNDKNTVLGGGMSFSWDKIRPTDPTEHGYAAGAEFDKKTITVSSSITQLLSRSSVMQFGFTYKNGQGFLTDPYKQVYFVLAGGPSNESRPDVRNQFTFLVRYNQFFSGPEASLHFDVQGYLDTWGVRSLALESSWYQQLGRRFQLIPSVRYYSQGQADFYVPYLDTANQPYYSSDYRVSPFGALQGGLRLEGVFDDWTKWAVWRIGIGYDYYWSSDKIALGNVGIGNPGLVRWGLLSGHIRGRF